MAPAVRHPYPRHRRKAFEVYFNALYQEMLPAFANAQQKGISLIVKVSLDSGWLSGRYRGKHQFDDVRNCWSPEVLERRTALVEKFAQIVPSDRSLAHTALQFCLAQPAVSTVIPGAKSVEQALDNIAAAESATARRKCAGPLRSMDERYYVPLTEYQKWDVVQFQGEA